MQTTFKRASIYHSLLIRAASLHSSNIQFAYALIRTAKEIENAMAPLREMCRTDSDIVNLERELRVIEQLEKSEAEKKITGLESNHANGIAKREEIANTEIQFDVYQVKRSCLPDNLVDDDRTNLQLIKVLVDIDFITGE